MEQEETTVDPQYLKGFNDGYLIAKHDPALASQLMANPNDHSEYFKGMMGGKEEYTRETREWAKSFSNRSLGKEDKGLDRER